MMKRLEQFCRRPGYQLTLSIALLSGLNPGAANANREAAELAMALDAFETMLISFGCPHALPTLNKTRADFVAQGGTGGRKKAAAVSTEPLL